MSKTRSLYKSFGFASQGFKEALKNEPNFQIHTIIGIIVVIAAWLSGFNTFEWLLLAFTIAFVLILELFNTSLEAIVDMVSPEIKPKAKIAKDVSAAAVLIAAVLSIIVGVALFATKLPL